MARKTKTKSIDIKVEDVTAEAIDYSPFTEAEYVKLKADLESIGSYLPTELTGEFWDYCNRIRGDKQPQPCGCKSASGLWARCVEVLRNYINGFK